MNTSVVICIQVVVAYIYTVNSETDYTVDDLKKHLKSTRRKYVNMADTDPLGALFFAGHATEEAVEIADELVENDLITMKRAVKRIMKVIRNGLLDTIQLPAVRLYSQNLCSAKQFAFPQAAVDKYPTWAAALNQKVRFLCGRLNITYGSQDE